MAAVAMGVVTRNAKEQMGEQFPSHDDGTYMPGVLVLGRFRTWDELKTMTFDDMRRGLIDALASLTSQPATHYQNMRDDELAGAGGVLTFLRVTGARTDDQLKTITDDDQRNLMIAALGPLAAMQGHGNELQGLSNIKLCFVAFGGYPWVDGSK